VAPLQVGQLCLGDAQLAALAALALQCEQAYGPRRDIEWAMQDGKLYLLQCRAVTTGQSRPDTPPRGPLQRDPVVAFAGDSALTDGPAARLVAPGRRFATGQLARRFAADGEAHQAFTAWPEIVERLLA